MSEDLEKRITAKMVLDSTGFNASLKGVNNELKLAQSELKNASASVGVFGKDSENLKNVQEALAKQVELHAKKVDLYKESIEKTTSKMNDNIKERDKLKESLEKSNKEYEEAVKLYGKESDEAKKAKDNVDNLTEEYKKKEKAVESNAKQINNYTTNLNKANAEMVTTQGELNKVTKELKEQDNKWIGASKSLKEHSEHLKNIGEKASSAGDKILKLSAPIVAVGAAAVKVGMDFDSQMSRVKAISGATGDEFKKLNDQALKLGADTAFSAKEAAEGMENLASAGFNTTEVMQAMPGMLDLAASSGEDLASSADIAASTLRGFGLEADKAGHVADVLAKNAADTNAAVADTGEAMKYVAPLARGMGLSLEEVTAAIGEMANAGIKGSQAGTTLRGALSKLADPSKEAASAMKEIGFNAFDSQGKLLPFRDVIERLQTSTEGLTDKQKQQAISTIFGQEAMSGMLTLVAAGPDELDKLTRSLKNSDGAAKNMAITMQDNAKASVEQMMGSMETAGIKLEQAIAPTIIKVADTVGKLADRFAALSPETQESIVKMVALSVGLGGVLKVGGGVISTVGSIAGGLSKLTGIIGAASVATEGVGVAATTATGVAGAGGLAGLGTALGGAVVAAGPFIAIAGGVALAGYGIHKAMTQEAVPAVNLFADKIEYTAGKMDNYNKRVGQTMEQTTIKISEGTKKSVGAYVKMDEDVSKILTNLYVNSTKITEDNTKSLIDKYKDMNTQIKQGMDNHYREQSTSMKNFFDKSDALSSEEERKALENLKKNNTDKKKETDQHLKEIQNILKKASDDKRALTLEEQQKINEIQEKMRTNAVKSLSNGEIESKVIIERLKNYSQRMTAEQASEVIKNAENQRKNSVNAAEKQYDDTIRNIIKMRDESKTITKDQADKLIKEAERQRDESVKKAGEMKDNVVKKMKEMNGDIIKDIDESDGHIKTRWERLKDWFANNPIIRWIRTESDDSDEPDRNWTGNSYFKGGLTYLHDAPGRNSNYELYDLPRGTRIYNHDASQDLVMQTAESVATKVAEGMLNKFNGANGISVVQKIYSPTPSPSEVARQTKNSLRELALNF